MATAQGLPRAFFMSAATASDSFLPSGVCFIRISCCTLDQWDSESFESMRRYFWHANAASWQLPNSNVRAQALAIIARTTARTENALCDRRVGLRAHELAIERILQQYDVMSMGTGPCDATNPQVCTLSDQGICFRPLVDEHELQFVRDGSAQQA
jgi:hypothetical protein